MRPKRRTELDLAFESIVCPNTFEDDPNIDDFFETVTDDTRKLSKAEKITSCLKMPKKETFTLPPSSSIRKTSSTKPTRKSKKSVVFADVASLKPKRKVSQKPSQNQPGPSHNLPGFASPCKIDAQQSDLPPKEELQVTPVMRNRKHQVEARKKSRSSRTIARDPDELIDRDCEEKKVKKYALGRWSFPAANQLVDEVAVDDVKPAKSTPLQGSKLRNKSRRCSLERKTTPRKRKSMTGTKHTVFDGRESLRKLSLIRTSINRRSRIPVRTKTFSARKNSASKTLPVQCASTKFETVRKQENVFSAKNKQENHCTMKTAKTIMKNTTRPKRPTNPKLNNTPNRPLAELVREFEKGPLKLRSQPTTSKRPAWRGVF